MYHFEFDKNIVSYGSMYGQDEDGRIHVLLDRAMRPGSLKRIMRLKQITEVVTHKWSGDYGYYRFYLEVLDYIKIDKSNYAFRFPFGHDFREYDYAFRVRIPAECIEGSLLVSDTYADADLILERPRGMSYDNYEMALRRTYRRVRATHSNRHGQLFNR